ncbi:hypothetical protein EMIT0324P_110037 [Pseudomonas chlororaphis]
MPFESSRAACAGSASVNASAAPMMNITGCLKEFGLSSVVIVYFLWCELCSAEPSLA